MNNIFKIVLLCGGLLADLALSQSPDDTGSVTAEAKPQSDQLRYAQAYLDLARVELQLAEQVNKQAPGAIHYLSMERKKNGVKVAEEQLSLALLPSDANGKIPLHLKYAEEQAKLAKRQYLQVLAMENRQKVYSDLELQRFRLQAEVAQLRFKVWSNPENVMSLLDHMHWQVDRLSEEVVDLQKRIDQLEQK